MSDFWILLALVALVLIGALLPLRASARGPKSGRRPGEDG
ncbi:MAG: hypothetical protein KatS3mg125_1720 [Lysobacterales bacterium]|jgi:hypothetical protein|nr:MAG: hypothetical protein KatS3mg125_1720 [Xanthomonadales bacterium]